MGGYRIASRYAKSLLELSREQKVLDKVKKDMDQLVNLGKEAREFSMMLDSPIIPHLRKSEILEKMFKGKLHPLSMAMMDLITRKGREKYFLQIAQEFVRQYEDLQGIQRAAVTTTFEIDDKLRKNFEKLVKDSTGRTPILTSKIDKDILGGFVLRMGDQQIDQSVSTQLKEIKIKFNEK